MVDSPYIPAESVAVERRPAVGYAMVFSAAALFAFNGAVSKVILHSGLSALRLTEVRCTGAFLGLAAILLATRPESLRTSPRGLADFVVTEHGVAPLRGKGERGRAEALIAIADPRFREELLSRATS